MDLVQELSKAGGSEAIKEILAKWAGEEISDTAAALSALQNIAWLYGKEMSEGHPEAAAQAASLQAAMKALKDFIVSEIQEADPDDVINLAEMASDMVKAQEADDLAKADASKCSKCGAELAADTRFCGNCGNKVA